MKWVHGVKHHHSMDHEHVELHARHCCNQHAVPLSRCTTPPQLSRKRDSTWRCALGQQNAGVVCIPSTAHGTRAAAIHSCGSDKPHWVAAPCLPLHTHSMLWAWLLPLGQGCSPVTAPQRNSTQQAAGNILSIPTSVRPPGDGLWCLARTVALASQAVHWHSLHVDCVGSATS